MVNMLSTVLCVFHYYKKDARKRLSRRNQEGTNISLYFTDALTSRDWMLISESFYNIDVDYIVDVDNNF